MYSKSKYTPKSKSILSKVDLQKSKWLLLIPIAFLLVWLVPILKRMYDSSVVRNKEAEIKNQIATNNYENNTADPVVIKNKSTQVAKKYPLITPLKWQELNTNAQIIAHAFGTNVEDNHVVFGASFFNVKSWTENEKLAVSKLKKHTGTYPALSELYYKVYTKSRNLTEDCLEYLSNSDIAVVRKSHLPYHNI